MLAIHFSCNFISTEKFAFMEIMSLAFSHIPKKMILLKNISQNFGMCSRPNTSENNHSLLKTRITNDLIV